MKKKLLAVVLALALVLGLGATAIAATGDVDLTVHFRDIVVTRDGEKVELKDEQGNVLEPFLYNASTYLPIRAIAEALGAEVNWDGATNTVSIDYPEQEPSYIYVPVETPAQPEPAELLSVVANVESEPYGKAIKSFTFNVTSTESLLGLTAEDFLCTHLVYDGNETHKPFDAQALNVTFTDTTMTVEVEPFYPDMSYTREGYWAMTCTDPMFSIDAGTPLTYVDPVVDAFENFMLPYGEDEEGNPQEMDCYLYTPENADGPLPIVIFNSGGTGISVTGDPYGANFAVSFAKEQSQEDWPCYVFYPQRTGGGSQADMMDAMVEYINGLVAEGKVDGNRIYMTGESAGTSFTVSFINRHPGFNTAIGIFAGGTADTEILDKQFDEEGNVLTKIMFIPCIGDTTADPQRFYQGYNYLVEKGMKPGVEVVWHAYTAQDFNALCGDNTYWEFMEDADYVTCPVTGVKTYNYPDGKLHNNSYPGANDTYIKQWLFNQSKVEFEAERSGDYSAKYKNDNNLVDYSIIPEKYTKVATLEGVPCVPAGTKTTVTVYTDDTETFYYITFSTFFQPGKTQYVECIVVGGVGRVVMDSSGTWWTADINNSTMPYLLSLDHIDWQPYVRDAE